MTTNKELRWQVKLLLEEREELLAELEPKPIRLKWRQIQPSAWWLMYDDKCVVVSWDGWWLMYRGTIAGVELMHESSTATGGEACRLAASEALVRQLKAKGVSASIERTSR